MSPEALQAIWLTIELAALTTILLLVIATPLAWWLAGTASRWRAPVSALVRCRRHPRGQGGGGFGHAGRRIPAAPHLFP